MKKKTTPRIILLLFVIIFFSGFKYEEPATMSYDVAMDLLVPVDNSQIILIKNIPIERYRPYLISITGTIVPVSPVNISVDCDDKKPFGRKYSCVIGVLDPFASTPVIQHSDVSFHECKSKTLAGFTGKCMDPVQITLQFPIAASAAADRIVQVYATNSTKITCEKASSTDLELKILKGTTIEVSRQPY